MKKLVLVIAILVFTLNMNAQISFGAKSGINIASISGDNTDLFEPKIGLVIGGVAEFKISDAFAVQPEILFSQQGISIENSNTKLKMNYLNLPIMAKYYPTTSLSLQFGPQIGFLLSAKADNGKVTVDRNDNFKTVDLGLGFGIGYKLDFGLFFDARYNIGLININDVNGTDKNYNSILNFSVGYYFN